MARVFDTSDDDSLLYFESRSNIFTEATWYLTIRNRKQYRELHRLERYESSPTIFILVNCALSVYFLFTKITALYYYTNAFTIISLIVTGLTPVLVGWMAIILRNFGHSVNGRHKHTLRVRRWVATLETVWAFGISLSYSLSLLVASYNGQCHSNSFAQYFGCNSNNPSYGSSEPRPNKLPEDMMVVLMVLPLLATLVCRAVRWEVIVSSFVMNLGVISFAIAYFELTLSLGSFIIYALLAALLLYETQRQNLALFLLYQHLYHTSKDNEKAAAVTTATEMRHMIGNVAHDLKSVSLCFVYCFIYH